MTAVYRCINIFHSANFLEFAADLHGHTHTHREERLGTIVIMLLVDVFLLVVKVIMDDIVLKVVFRDNS